jgi:hypothetical protein
MGAVYLARDPELDQHVALKVAGTDPGSGTAVAHRRLRREFRLMQRLRHDHIVDLDELFEDGGLQFFSMEYVDGGNLHRHLGVAEGMSWGLPSERPTEAGRARPARGSGARPAASRSKRGPRGKRTTPRPATAPSPSFGEGRAAGSLQPTDPEAVWRRSASSSTPSPSSRYGSCTATSSRRTS